MGHLVIAPDSTHPAMHTPRKADSPDRPLMQVIAFDIDAPLSFHYTPYVVEVIDVTNETIKFKFINANSGTRVSNTVHTLNRQALATVHDKLPSTLPTPADLQAERRISLLFINADAITGTMANEAAASDAEGKWPKTAESTVAQTLRELLQNPAVTRALSDSQRARLKNLGFEMAEA